LYVEYAEEEEEEEEDTIIAPQRYGHIAVGLWRNAFQT
jgi:hypothetical protein